MIHEYPQVKIVHTYVEALATVLMGDYQADYFVGCTVLDPDPSNAFDLALLKSLYTNRRSFPDSADDYIARAIHDWFFLEGILL